MTKKIHILLLVLMSAYQIHAQQLANTTWVTYSPLLTDSLYVTITTDSVFQKDKSGILFVSSWYKETGDTLYILDGSGPYKCPNPDTGVYNFTIFSDSMYILLINDDCINRALSYNGVLLFKTGGTIGVNKIKNEDISFEVFYNKSQVQISAFQNGQLNVYNSNGQIVYQEQMGLETRSISLLKGYYLFQFVSDENKVEVIKIMVY